ncbi:MAG TPA: permease-like cell division protein FtsX [Candidatus Limnocylindria bacterium]|nr:permease-like cell division protein FtsX [Candidatus Limnocylindria bacterium]
MGFVTGFLRFCGFSVVRAWQGFWRNAMMSLAATATVILMLVLLSGLFIVLTGLNSGIEFIERKVGVTAELVDDLSDERLQTLIERAEALDGVTDVAYISPDQAMRRLEEAFAQRGQTLSTGGANIQLQATLEITLAEPAFADEVSLALAGDGAVSKVITKQEEIDTLVGVINVIRTVGLVAIGLIGLTVLFMIVNTIRIAVYSRSNEIEIMRLVGASDSFIRWPFILEGILCGLIGAVVAVIAVSVVWDPIQPILVSVFQMPTAVSARNLASLSALLFAVGVGIGAVGSWISVRSYLSAAA